MTQRALDLIEEAISLVDIRVTFDSIGRRHTQVSNAREVAEAILRITGAENEKLRELHVAMQSEVLRAQASEEELRASLLEAVGALEGIATLEPLPFEGGVDWAAIDACPDCKAYKDHPIQSGICNVHRRPMWDREKHDDREERRLGWRAKSAAREAAARLSSSLEGGEG